jgi:predicted lipase
MDDELYFTGPRDYDEQTDAFRFELDSIVDRYLKEFDINTFVMIGALREKEQELIDSGNIDIELDSRINNLTSVRK